MFLARPCRSLAALPSTRLHPRLWLAFILLCAAGLALTWWQHWELERRQRDLQNREMAYSLLEQKIMAPFYRRWIASAQRQGTLSVRGARLRHLRLGPAITDLYWGIARHFQGPSKREAERILNQGRPFETVREEARERIWLQGGRVGASDMYDVANYVDPVHGLEFKLYFAGNLFEGYERIAPPVPSTVPPVGWSLCQTCRKVIMRYDGYAWLVLLLLALGLRRHRILMAELLMMVAVIFTIERMSIPNSWQWFQYSFLQGTSLPWGLAMLGVGLAVLSWAYFSQQARRRLACPVCEYNLLGNISGVCPECGTSIPEELHRHLVAIASPSPEKKSRCAPPAAPAPGRLMG